MTFYLLTAVAIALALFFTLRPLMARSARERDLRQRIRTIETAGPDLAPNDWQQRRADLQQQLNDTQNHSGIGHGLGLLLLVLIPLATFSLYQAIGTPQGLQPDTSRSAELRQMLGDLTATVVNEPRDIEAWLQIGIIQKNLQQFSAAEGAWRRVLYLDPDEPFALVELAETLLFASGQTALPDESRQLIDHALSIQPDNQKALWLSGIDAFQQRDFDTAIARWRTLEPLLPEGSVLEQVQQQIRRAEQMLTGLGDVHAGAGIETNAPSVSSEANTIAADVNPTEADAAISVRIDLDENLQAELSGNETLFVFARALSGPPAPLAVQRLPVSDWPVELSLSDADAMAPGLTLSSFDQVEIVARISATGNAIAQPGDLEGISDPIATSESSAVLIQIRQAIE
ncbi:MAG: hypothetical protein AAF446_05660 [Pseudomonadota bacterium]